MAAFLLSSMISPSLHQRSYVRLLIPTVSHAGINLAPLLLASFIKSTILMRSSMLINLPRFPRKSHLTFFLKLVMQQFQLMLSPLFLNPFVAL